MAGGRRTGAVIWTGQSGALTGTSKVVTAVGARAGDTVLFSPFNSSAAALVGTAGGVYAVADTDKVTLTYPTAAGTEVVQILVIAGNLSGNAA